MRDALPTFRNNKDRLVYLAAKYWIPLSITAAAAGLWFIAFTPALPSVPPAYLWFATGWGIFALPGYFFGLKVADWLRTRDMVLVGVADPGTDERYDVRWIPTDVWDDALVRGATPLEPEDGQCDYVVTDFEWYGDLSQLEVRGCEREDLTPGEAWESKERVDDYYEHHQSLKRQYSRMKATLSDKISEVHDLTVMRMIAEREDAELAINRDITGLVEDMEDAVEDLPDGPEPNHDVDVPEPEGEHFDLDHNPDLNPGANPGQNPGQNTGGPPAAADGGENREQRRR